MNFLQDPIIPAILALVAIVTIVVLWPRRRQELWLVLLTVLLFGLPRAGMLIRQMNLPLPVAHVLSVMVIIVWLFMRRSQRYQEGHWGRFFLLYAAIAGFGLILGLSTGGKQSVAVLELFFYLVSMGVFFYARDTFFKKRHFLMFTWLILFLSVLVSLYGIRKNI